VESCWSLDLSLTVDSLEPCLGLITVLMDPCFKSCWSLAGVPGKIFAVDSQGSCWSLGALLACKAARALLGHENPFRPNLLALGKERANQVQGGPPTPQYALHAPARPSTPRHAPPRPATPYAGLGY
jgi:hypothetical protein